MAEKVKTATRRFRWDDDKFFLVQLLAEGSTVREASQKSGISERSIFRYKLEPEFDAELTRVSLMVGVANKAERLRIINRYVRQMIRDNKPIASSKDVLDWLKAARDEIEGSKIDLTAIFDVGGEK